MASAGIHHLRMANTKDINTIQYAENKTQSEVEYINIKITTCTKWHRINSRLPVNYHHVHLVMLVVCLLWL